MHSSTRQAPKSPPSETLPPPSAVLSWAPGPAESISLKASYTARAPDSPSPSCSKSPMLSWKELNERNQLSWVLGNNYPPLSLSPQEGRPSSPQPWQPQHPPHLSGHSPQKPGACRAQPAPLQDSSSVQGLLLQRDCSACVLPSDSQPQVPTCSPPVGV